MKREVNMCDKKGCDCAAAAKCMLCDQDVCLREHSTKINLAYKGDDKAYYMPLPLVICHDCGEATVVKSPTSDPRYVVRGKDWPDDLAERVAPLFEVIKAAMAKEALTKKRTAEVGEYGPQGDQGPQGATGAFGPQGSAPLSKAKRFRQLTNNSYDAAGVAGALDKDNE